MNFNRKKLSLVITLILTVSLFIIGCGNKTEQTNSSKNDVENKEKIVVGASGEFFPLNFKKNDVLQGFEIDVWNEIGKRTGYEVEYKIAKFAGLFGMLDAGQVDTIAHQVAVNTEREAKYAFTEPYLYANYQLVTKKDSELSKLEDFKGKKVGVVMGGMGEKKLKEVSEENNLDINIQGYEGVAGMDMDLDMERLDARLGPAIQTRATIEDKNLDFKVTDVVIFYESAAFPFSKDEENGKKIEEINKALSSMKEDGTMSELSMKWFGEDATVKR
jgi:putative amino-acid transport system substrate-binding protein